MRRPNLATATLLAACCVLGCGDGIQEGTGAVGATSEGSASGSAGEVTVLPGSGSGDPSTSEGSSTSTGSETSSVTGGEHSTEDASSGVADSSRLDVPLREVPFLVGFHTADISPTPADLALNNIYMGGYGAPFVRGPAQGVHDAIFIRSMAVELAGEGFVLAVADLPGLGNDFTGEIRARVSTQLSLDPERVLVGTTHTHAGPDFQGLWGGGPSVYRNRVVDVIVGSMNNAWVSRDEADLEVATVDAPNHNRRDWEYTDDSLTVLLAQTHKGQVLGTLGVFAAHPTVLGQSNRLISRDWCGAFVDALETEFEAPAVLFNGALGDASTATPEGNYADDFERADAYGSMLAELALEALATRERIEPSLYIDHRSWTIPVSNALFQIAAGLGILDYDFSSTNGGQEVTTGSTYLRLGDQLQIVTFPGESLTRNALDIKASMSLPHQMLLGQTGDSLGYFVPSDEWMTGRNDDYEETVSLNEIAGDLTRDTLVEMIEADRF